MNNLDIEGCANDKFYLDNSVVQNLSWSNITATAPEREPKLPKQILSAVTGLVTSDKSRLDI